MSRKHFESLAAEFKFQVNVNNESAYLTPDQKHLALKVIRDCVAGFCRAAYTDNPRFDVGRFLKACGL